MATRYDDALAARRRLRRASRRGLPPVLRGGASTDLDRARADVPGVGRDRAVRPPRPRVPGARLRDRARRVPRARRASRSRADGADPLDVRPARGPTQLDRALLGRADDAPTVTFMPDATTVHFWRRRMALETLVHRTDAELAVGDVAPMDDDLSADGVDELLWFGTHPENDDADGDRRPRRSSRSPTARGRWRVDAHRRGDRRADVERAGRRDGARLAPRRCCSRCRVGTSRASARPRFGVEVPDGRRATPRPTSGCSRGSARSSPHRRPIGRLSGPQLPEGARLHRRRARRDWSSSPASSRRGGSRGRHGPAARRRGPSPSSSRRPRRARARPSRSPPTSRART